MDCSRLKVAIVIISDTAHRTPAADKTIPLLTNVIADEGDGHWVVEAQCIIPDDEDKIKRTIEEWCDSEAPVNLILTSGGTGFAVKDRTPEAIGPLIERHAPGLV